MPYLLEFAIEVEMLDEIMCPDKIVIARIYCECLLSVYPTQSHADCLPDHVMEPINSSNLGSHDAGNLRFCSTHTDQALNLGCNRCWKICCAKCTTSLEPCTNGEWGAVCQ